MKDQGEWLKQMGDLQQQYWNGWREMASQSMGHAAPPPPNTPWQDSLDAWNRAKGGAGADLGATGFGGVPGFGAAPGAFSGFGQNDVGQRMFAHGKQYLDLLQGMVSGGGFQSGPQFDPRGWIQEMRSLHERHGQNVMGANLGSVPWFGGIDQSQIEQMVKSFAGSPMRGMQQEWQGMLGVPTFGLGREHQERKQQLLRNWLDYQVVKQRYNDLMLTSTAKTFDVLEGKLAQRDQSGSPIESARALYDLWIDAAEDAFAEIAMSPDYRATYGELVNGQMRVRAGINDEIERMGAQFGLPTRTEVDSLSRQVHELKRELRRRTSGEVQPLETGARAPARPRASTSDATPARAASPRADAPSSRQRATKKTRTAAAVSSAKPVATAKAKRPGKAAKARHTQRAANDAPMIQSTARKSVKRS